MNKLYSILMIIFFTLCAPVFFCTALVIRLVTAPFDPRRIVTNTFSALWASFYLWVVPAWSVKIIDRHKLSIAQNHVMVSNHQSQLDILVLYRLLFPYRWVSKAAVFKLPFIGWNMILNGDIKLKRGDKKSIQEMMDKCEALLRQNISVFFFPEGTRSKDGRLRPFKPGAFLMAKNTSTPIQPIVLNYTKDALPKHSLTIEPCPQMEVKVLDEIPVSQFRHLPPEKIAEMVRSTIAPHVVTKDDKAPSETAIA